MSSDEQVYVEIIQTLRTVCEQYRAQIISWSTFRATMFEAKTSLGDLGGSSMRQLMIWATDSLELLEFALAGDELFEETLNVIAEIEARIWE